MDSRIAEAFGKFMVQGADGKISTFDTIEDANESLIFDTHKADIEAKSAAYVSSRKYEGKVAATKLKVVQDFLLYQAGLGA